MTQLPDGVKGYAHELEDRDDLEQNGMEPTELVAKFKDSFPTWNPVYEPDVLIVENQGGQGSCQGHALALVFQVCYFLATGRIERFSRACGYYMAQKKDNINGDRGSTLSGGRWVAQEHGMCLEEHWPYPSRYNNRKPSGIEFPYKLNVSKPLKSAEEVWSFLELGLPVQIGIMWGDSVNREIVDSYRKGGGGHSTTFWGMTRNGLAYNNNSWGRNWNGDGRHKWTKQAVQQNFERDRWAVWIGYGPDGMSFPDPDPIKPN